MLDIKLYKAENLCSILFDANKGHTPLELIRESNQHIKFLYEYLGSIHGLNARFYVKENDYINVDYLTDYSFYYSKSFNDYGNKCVRLHFFTFENDDIQVFSAKLFSEVTINNPASKDDSTFWDKYYLGYIVIRPIPTSFIGHTILKHYNYKIDASTYDQLRTYWATKEYSINFYGKKIKVNSLAFMSQDGNVAACATIAVWCMLQIAVENYSINIKSPYEITRDAGITVHNGNRLIPNTGLDPVSICVAITKSNLVTEIREFQSADGTRIDNNANDRIKKLINAYSNIRLPIILGMKVPINGTYIGHAIAVCGFSTSPSNNSPPSLRSFFRSLRKDDTIVWRAQNIDKLYAHDDQWGPYAKMDLVGNNEISSSWTLHTDEVVNCMPIAIIIPVFQKIRISYEEIESSTKGLNYFIHRELGYQLNFKKSWDIKLHYSSDYKELVKYSGLLNPDIFKENELLLNFLTTPLPKYIWVSTLYFGEYQIMDFIYDATGLRHTNCFLFSLCYYHEIFDAFISRLKEINVQYTQNHKVKVELQYILGDSIERFINNITKLSNNE